MTRIALNSAFILLVLTACGTNTSVPDYQSAVGSYLLDVATSPSSGLRIMLHLNDDLTASMEYDYVNDEPASVETGTWMIEEDGTISIRLTETNGVPMYPVVEFGFALENGALESVAWDRSLFGSEKMVFFRI